MIELLIFISVAGLMITIGTSSYRKAQERQALRTDVEALLEVFQSAKKQAVIGEKDCSGPLIGIQITITQNNANITHQAICRSSSGTTRTTTLGSSVPSTSTTFRFRSLDGSTNLSPSGTTFNLTTPGGLIGNITISQAGAITYAYP